jgi:hypothetical protein
MADPAASGHPLCPFCGGELLPEQELSEDHVFERSLGGRVVVTAHRTCNNQSGSAAEGNLQRPNTVINIIKAAKGLHTSPVQGVFSSGRPASVNFRDGSVHSPPTVHKADDGTALRIEGTPAEAEKAYSNWRARNPHLNAPEFKDLPPELITSVSYDKVNVAVDYSLKDAEIVAVKSALGACVLAYGSAFATSGFAAALRAVQDDPANLQRPRGCPAYLDMLDVNISVAAAQAGLSAAEIYGLPRLVPAAGETVHDVILVPLTGQQTLLFAHYTSVLIPPYGIMIGVRLPPLTPDVQPILPILLRDGGAKHRLDVTDFTRRLLQPAIDALPAVADDYNP